METLVDDQPLAEEDKAVVTPIETVFYPQTAQQQLEAHHHQRGVGKAACAAALVLIAGIIIGTAGDRQFGNTVMPLTLQAYQQYGAVLDRGETAAVHPFPTPCAGIKAFAGTVRIPTPPAIYTHAAAEFMRAAQILPQGPTTASPPPPPLTSNPAVALLYGGSVHTVRVAWATTSDRVIVVTAAAHDDSDTPPVVSPLACPPTCVPEAVGQCVDHVLAVVREMVGCACCGTTPTIDCPSGVTVAIAHPIAVCRRFPLTAEHARHAVYTLPPLLPAALAARYWPDDVTFTPASPAETMAIRAVVGAVVDAYNRRTNNSLQPEIHVGTPHQTPNAAIDVHVNSTFATFDALRRDVEQQHAAALFRSGAPPTDHTGTITVTYDPHFNTVVVPLGVLTEPLLAYRAGIIAYSTAVALAPATAPCTNEIAAELFAGARAKLSLSHLLPPPLQALDGMRIGPDQLYYMGGAAIATSDSTQIGYVPDPHYADAFDCAPVVNQHSRCAT
jgi:hypothetical protein